MIKHRINPQQNNLNHQNKLINQHNQYISLLKQLVLIFQKSYEHRSNNDHNKFHKLVQKINFFKELQKSFSSELLKSIFKNGRLIHLNENYLVTQQNKSIEFFVIALNGQFGIKKGANSSNKFILESKQQQDKYYESLSSYSQSYLQFIRKKQPKLPRTYEPKKQDYINIYYQQTIKVHPGRQIVLVTASQLSHPADGNKHSESIITLGKQNYLFYIDFKRLSSSIQQQHDKQIIKQMQIFLTFNCFKLFKKQKLKRLVQDLQLKTAKKHQVLFKQGDNDNRIFILTKGQVSLQKNAQLGKQNPNKLYKNRLSLQREDFKIKNKEKINIIPYADFSKVYSVNIQTKKVRLSTICPISILGQQQIISQTNCRQTTATVQSQTANYYVFTPQFLSHYITKDSHFTLEDFLSRLEQQITDKKILYRQQKLGQQVHFMNKNADNGFYINQKPRKSQMRSSRDSIRKLNKTLNLIKIEKDNPKNNENDESNDTFLTASFTNHNFQEYYKANTQAKNSIQNIVMQNPIPAPKRSIPKSQKFKRIQYSQAQKQVMKLLHLNERINQKMTPQFSHSKSQKLTPSFAIDIEKPLFTPQYFQRQLSQNKRIQNQMKKSKLKSLYSSTIDSRRKYMKSKTLQRSVQLSNPSSSRRLQYSYQL